MIAQVTANDLKTKGVNFLDEISRESDGVIITVRGKEKYVILPIEEYNQLREYELDAAIRDARADIEANRYQTGTVEEHLERIGHV
ncbi:MAG: type II toxin-antitoxin system Phd/YefM family antitoxin [Spirochaetales bacterium]|nr:type II toxin-antitoxin system Phd/YefM family antitoxin [Spirochaetales bacterium]